MSTLFNMVNVPQGVWIDEEGRLVRPPEMAYSRDMQFGPMTVEGGDRYVRALRDWVKNGKDSIYVMDPDALAEKLKRSEDQCLADVHFRMGAHFRNAGDPDRAKKHWEKAQKLRPESWNDHRQDWSYTPAQAGGKWFRKYMGLRGKPYYDPLELPEPGEEPKKKPDAEKKPESKKRAPY